MKRTNETTKSTTPVAANTTHGPKTLRELGVDGALAAEFELALRMLGATRDGDVVGYTFLSPDGARHALRLEGEAAADRRAA